MMELKSSQIALAGVIVRLADQLVVTPSHYLALSGKDMLAKWSTGLSSTILSTVIIILLFVMLHNDKTKIHGAIFSVLFGIWFITSGILGVGLSAILFLLASPMQFAFTFTPAILMIIAGHYYLMRENAKTARQIEELKSKIF